MTDREMNEILVTLDNVWDGLDEGREAGYRYVLGEEPYEIVAAAVKSMSREDRHWLPRAPEIFARIELIRRDRRIQESYAENLERLERQLRAELETAAPTILGGKP